MRPLTPLTPEEEERLTELQAAHLGAGEHPGDSEELTEAIFGIGRAVLARRTSER